MLYTKNSKKKSKGQDDAETRKFAVKSLNSITKIIGINSFNVEQLKKIFNILFETINDYTLDKRGDIGLFTREATMYALIDFLAMAGDYL